MSEKLDKWHFIFPPRTSTVLPPGPSDARIMWESFPDVIGQWKLNGTRNMTVIHPDGNIELWGRGRQGQPGEIQRQIPLTAAMRTQIINLQLPHGKLHVLDGEFIHAKTSTIKDVLYLFDILVYNSEHLIGATGNERWQLLFDIMGRQGSRHFPLDPAGWPAYDAIKPTAPQSGTIYLAQNYNASAWDSMYQKALEIPYCEGVVIKRMGPVSALQYGGQEYNNSGWMARMRKPNKMYRS